MNWLAHLRLAPTQPLLRIGNLLGDFVRGVDLGQLPDELRAGIAQHRAVDRFTDAHPVFRRSRDRLDAGYRRFAGVLVDVYYDHFLARDWPRFGDGRPLAAFTAEIYAELAAHARWLPASLQAIVPRMASENWLLGYAELDGIDDVLRRMGQRLSRPSPLGHGGQPLRRHYAALAADFAEFFPQVQALAAALPRHLAGDYRVNNAAMSSNRGPSPSHTAYCDG